MKPSILTLCLAASLVGCAPPVKIAAAPVENTVVVPWPPLPTKGFIRGRPATLEDVSAGNAIFVAAHFGKLTGEPINISIPQYAEWTSPKSNHVKKVVVVQAERAQDFDLVGFIDVATGKLVTAKLDEISLLGTRRDVLSNP
jgi:hypothetical protein